MVAKSETAIKSRSESEMAELFDQISKAQQEAGTRLIEAAGAAKASVLPEPGSISAMDIYGNWTDSFGNIVCVYSMDAFESRLVATLSKPPRRDINLSLQPLADGTGWLCGRGVLDHGRSSISEGKLCWVFPNGSVSTWKRIQNDLSAGGIQQGEVAPVQGEERKLATMGWGTQPPLPPVSWQGGAPPHALMMQQMMAA
mmetsp:Transcript_18005/g.42073  ORF Transcript_18005/g.42073 Transcript_18005/m.42073 type:complete len:199 (+) Transcript_18005:94-690(+)|eukprot:CAMPEP_0178413860 /NCGR_PEP_ID=MMETSP0689_2-20121128/22743_1 /TAXON_ID=160604 /ORGANISM="Amphidinium massartii, Strain CS-259" /LENGTH=198 /DNA_ID=CAMNT_0020035141 /DNA_START=89 /DNA_END=685 /DNA_ORIENTATION=+